MVHLPTQYESNCVWIGYMMEFWQATPEFSMNGKSSIMTLTPQSKDYIWMQVLQDLGCSHCKAQMEPLWQQNSGAPHQLSISGWEGQGYGGPGGLRRKWEAELGSSFCLIPTLVSEQPLASTSEVAGFYIQRTE